MTSVTGLKATKSTAAVAGNLSADIARSPPAWTSNR